MAGLYYCANTHLPDGFSDAFVDSLKPLQWGLGTLFFLGRCGLEQREQEEEEDEEQQPPPQQAGGSGGRPPQANPTVGTTTTAAAAAAADTAMGYTLLRCATSGELLTDGDSGLSHSPRGDDAAMWIDHDADGRTFRHALTGRLVHADDRHYAEVPAPSNEYTTDRIDIYRGNRKDSDDILLSTFECILGWSRWGQRCYHQSTWRSCDRAESLSCAPPPQVRIALSVCFLSLRFRL
jgi:hypothetical protein